jgi:peptidyl-prolyl cis-trans isomerase C
MTGKISSDRFAFRLLVTMIIGLFTLAVSNGVSTAAPPAERDVLVRWGKKTITKQDVEARISQYPQEVQEKLKDPAQRKQYLESLIQIQITGAEAKALKLDKRKNVAVRIADMTNSILVQEYINEIVKTLKPPTDKEAEAFFTENKSSYFAPASVRAQHILIEVKPDAKPEDVTAAEAKAKKVYDELAAGADFGKLAEKYSEDTESKAKGGDLGLLNAEQTVPEFSKPVFSMKKDELSKPFRTPFGFHIAKVNEVIPAKQMEFKDIREDVLMKLDNQNREKLIYDELERLKKKYKVKFY